MAENKRKVLLIGGGAVGAIAGLNLEAGNLATVTMVLRSNYNIVLERGYSIESCDHGIIESWRPTTLRNTVPDLIKEGLPPYDYVILTTKNCPDISPTALDLVSPALPSNCDQTTLVLYQNGLNIEKPFQKSHPDLPILSGISMIGTDEPSSGKIIHGQDENLRIGAFCGSPDAERQAQDFVRIYSASGKGSCTYSPHVQYERWRKLVFNACLNPVCAITGLDTGRIRLAGDAVERLLRPAMREIVVAARAAADVELGEDVVEQMINADPLESYLKPSMQQDLEKGSFLEFENLLGEPLREGKRAGVAMPTVEVLYNLTKAVQWRTKERKGLIEIPRM